jgi:outer membrane protein assembly factor BamB
MSQPLCRDGYGYLLDKQFGLTCFEWATGKKIWDDHHRVTARDTNPQATLVWIGDGDHALILNAEGELILARLNPSRYTELARAKIIGRTWAHPAYAGRCVYARDDHELVCCELP